MSVVLKIKSRPECDDVIIDKKFEKIISEFGWWEAHNGYIMARVKKQWKQIIPTTRVLLHMLVWFLEKGVWPEQEIDHLNRKKHDNRIGNLRPVTHAVNQKNQKQRDGTISGRQGVFLEKGKYWRADLVVSKDGKVHHIRSSTTKDKYIAELAQDCLRYLQGEYIGYHHPELAFYQKWGIIGEKQRRQILHSFEKHGIETVIKLEAA
jgi:hypothetical protein